MKAATILLYLILFGGDSCHGLDRSTLPVAPARNAGQESQGPVLTLKEEQNFYSLTNRHILWFLDWRHPEISCHNGGVINIVTNYRQLVGQQIDLKLVTTRKYVFAYFGQLHFRILFLRDAERGLTSPQLQPFCEPTNDEAVARFRSSDQPLLDDQPIYQEDLIPIKLNFMDGQLFPAILRWGIGLPLWTRSLT